MAVPLSWQHTEQQKAERARFIVEKAEQEQLAEVIRAEGDSEVRRLPWRTVPIYHWLCFGLFCHRQRLIHRPVAPLTARRLLAQSGHHGGSFVLKSLTLVWLLRQFSPVLLI